MPETKALGHEREYVVTFGPRRYRVRGLEKNLSYEVLKVNLLASAPASDGVGEASTSIRSTCTKPERVRRS